MTPTRRRYPKEEIARRGDEIYQREIRPKLSGADKGKFAAIDIETGTYEIGADELEVCHRLRARVPDSQTWLVRIGYRSLRSFGGRNQPDDL